MKRRSKVPEEKKRDKQEDLRGENRRLRKEVQQLRKLVQRQSHRDQDVAEMIEYLDSPQHKEDQIEKEQRFECPKCHCHDTKVIDLGHGHYYSCNQCEAKGPLK